MRIVYVLTTADAAGGTERTIISQANWMSQHADVSILSLYKTAASPHFSISRRVGVKYAVKDGFPAQRTPSLLVPETWDNQFDSTTDNAVERAFQKIRADIVVTTTPALALLAARYTSRRSRLVHQEHRHSPQRGEGVKPLLAAANRFSLIAVLTERNREWLATALDGRGPRVVVVPNGIDVGSFAQSSLSQPLVVSAGRLVPAKQFDHLLRAFSIATRKHSEWRLRIYGDGPAKRNLRVQAHRLGIESRLELPGSVESIDTQLAKGSIFALASRSEALPMVLLEAQAAGVPVVSYDIATGPREIISQTGGGLLIPEKSVHGLASAIECLIDDEALRRHLGETARLNAWAFDLDAVMPTWLKLFDAVVRGLSAPSLPLVVPNDSPSLQGCDEAAPQDRVDPSAVEKRSLGLHASISACFDRDLVPWTQGTERDGGWRLIAGHEHVGSLLRFLDTTDLDFEVCARRGNEQVAPTWNSADDSNPPLAPYATRFTFSDEQGTRIGSVELWPIDGSVRTRPAAGDGPEWVDQETWTKWMASRSRTPSGKRYWNSPEFDIDVVYTWVDGSDPAWRARRAPFLPPEADDADAARELRYHSRNELYYSVSSVVRRMPWVRTIHVVTDRQLPERVLREFPHVRVVDHAEIFPDPTVLPVFNSHAIEASLHRIPGLAEHFIYFNDDFLVSRPLSADVFFHGNGTPKFFPHGISLAHGELSEYPHLQAAANNRRLLGEEFGLEITRGLLHAPYAHRKSVVAALEGRFPKDFAQTRASRFRSHTDISVLSSLGQYFGYATNRYMPDTIRCRFVSLREDALAARLSQALTDKSLQVVALGEAPLGERRHRDESQLVTDFLRDFLRA